VTKHYSPPKTKPFAAADFEFYFPCKEHIFNIRSGAKSKNSEKVSVLSFDATWVLCSIKKKKKD